MEKLKINAIFIVLLLVNNLNCESICSCPSQIPKPPSNLPDRKSSFKAQPEIIDKVDYGTPFVLSNLVFLKQDFTPDQSITELNVKCPTGYRAPTAHEMQKMIADIGESKIYSTLIDPQGFAANTKFKYFTSTKKFPESTKGEDYNSWVFKAIEFDSAKKIVTIVDINTYFENKKKTMAVKCVMNSTSNNLPLTYEDKDFTVGVSYPFSTKTNNLVSYYWSWGDGQKSTTPSPNIKFSSAGCSIIQVWAKNMANAILYSCIPKFIVQPFGSDSATSLDAKTINHIKLPFTAQTDRSIFFSTGKVPIAPKSSGGLYLLYTDLKTNMLNVVEFDKDLKKINEKNLEIQAYAFDAVSTDSGLVIYAQNAKDKNSSFLLGYSSDFKKRFQRTIMNNGDKPTKKKSDQIFFSDDKGKILFGLDAMFSPSNGKLVYGRKKIGLIFAHYNFFGNSGNHTGDTYFIFDENGNNETYAWSWGTSHSLVQSQIYDGRYFITASLGDAYPENIKVCLIDPTAVEGNIDSVRKGKFNNPHKCTELLPYKLPGDGGGKSCARLGGIVNKGNDYAVIYSIRPCSLKSSTNKNEIAMVTFKIENFEIKNLTQKSLISNASKVVNLRAGKYGDKILIAYSEDPTQKDYDAGNMSYKGKEEMSLTLVNFDGTVNTKPFKLSPAAVSVSDEMKFLSDGRLVWGYVDFQNNVSLYSTSVPPKNEGVKLGLRVELN